MYDLMLTEKHLHVIMWVEYFERASLQCHMAVYYYSDSCYLHFVNKSSKGLQMPKVKKVDFL